MCTATLAFSLTRTVRAAGDAPLFLFPLSGLPWWPGTSLSPHWLVSYSISCTPLLPVLLIVSVHLYLEYLTIIYFTHVPCVIQ